MYLRQLGKDDSYIQTGNYGAVFSRHPSEASFVGAGSLAGGSSVSVWFTPLSLCSRPEYSAWRGSWYWSGPWMGALDLRLNLKAIKEAVLQSNVFHRGARGGGGHLHYVTLFRFGAEADRPSWASLSLAPTTLTITEKKATQKHIRFRLFLRHLMTRVRLTVQLGH